MGYWNKKINREMWAIVPVSDGSRNSVGGSCVRIARVTILEVCGESVKCQAAGESWLLDPTSFDDVVENLLPQVDYINS